MKKIKCLLMVLMVTLFVAEFGNAQVGPLPADYNAAFGGGQGYVIDPNNRYLSAKMNQWGEIITAAENRLTVYDANGNLLRTRLTPFGTNRIAIDGGDIIAVGNITNGVIQADLVVTRYNRNLKQNMKFGTNGVLRFQVANFPINRPLAVEVQNNGDIVIGGRVETSIANLDYQQFVAKVTRKGDLDTSFGGTGYVVNALGFNHGLNSLALYGNGQNVSIITSGSSLSCATCFPSIASVTVFDRFGNRDPNFNQGNIFTINGKTISAMAVQPDGKILLGDVAQSFGVLRLLRNGTLDPTFGTNGIASTQFPNFLTIVNLSVDLLGRIVICGSVFFPAPENVNKIFVARYNPNGTLDTTFISSAGQTIPPEIRILEFANEPSHFPTKQLLMGNQIIIVGRLGGENRSAIVKLNGQ